MANSFQRVLSVNTSPPTFGDDVSELQRELHKYNYLDQNCVTGYYTSNISQAVKKYQSDNCLNVNGEVDKDTWDMLFDNEDNTYVKQIKDQQKKLQSTTQSLNNTLPAASRSSVVYATKQMSTNNNPSLYALKNNLHFGGESKYTPFFAEDNSSILRKANQTLKIFYGEETGKTKTIMNLFLRNKSQIIDANGTPIFDTYEFIGSDIVENDNVFTIPKSTNSNSQQ